MILHCSNEAHVHLLHPVRAHDLINQLAKELISLLLQGIRWQDARNRIYYLRDNDCDSMNQAA